MAIAKQVTISESEYAELVAAKTKLEQRQVLTLKVGEKGGLCFYGMGRFPVNLYENQAATMRDILTDKVEVVDGMSVVSPKPRIRFSAFCKSYADRITSK